MTSQKRDPNRYTGCGCFMALGILLLLVAGLLSAPVLFFPPGDRVICGGVAMDPGETCVSYRNGTEVGNNTIEEQRRNQSIGFYVMAGLAALIGVLGLLCIYASIRAYFSLRKEASSPQQ